MPIAHIENAAEAITSIGSWEPENITEVDDFLQDLGQLYEALAVMQANLAQRFATDLPIGSAVVEHLSELASAAGSLTDHANQARGIFRSQHAEEFERLENPRPREELWDYRANH
jgi:hypothetical protein